MAYCWLLEWVPEFVVWVVVIAFVFMGCVAFCVVLICVFAGFDLFCWCALWCNDLVLRWFVALCCCVVLGFVVVVFDFGVLWCG